MADLKLAVAVSLQDHLSTGLRGLTRGVDQFADHARRASVALGAMSRSSIAAGTLLTAAMVQPIQSFREWEDAGTRLKVSMMGIGGALAPEFASVNALAKVIGDRLPGSTADFQAMMAALKEEGVGARDILTGVGEATAYLGVQLKMAPDAAGQFAARLSKSVGVASKDMMGFMDLIARAKNVGIDPEEMRYAYGRSSGKLKQMGVQGLQAGRDLAPIYASLIPSLGGETVGTGFASILSGLEKFRDQSTKAAVGARKELKRLKIDLDIFDKDGKFRGVTNLVNQLDKLRTLKPAQLTEVIGGLAGGGQDGQMLASIIQDGRAGYAAMAERLAEQATLQEKVDAILDTLTSKWDAATGTLENTTATWINTISPELKAMADGLGRYSSQLGTWIEGNTGTARWATVVGPALIGLGTGLAGLAGLATGLGWLSRFFAKGKGAGGLAGALGSAVPMPVWVVGGALTGVSGMPGAGGAGAAGAAGAGARAFGTGSIVLDVVAVLGAGAVGYAIGTAIYEKALAGTNIGDAIGAAVARVVDGWNGKAQPLGLREIPPLPADPEHGLHPQRIPAAQMAWDWVKKQVGQGPADGALGPAVQTLTSAADTQRTAATTADQAAAKSMQGANAFDSAVGRFAAAAATPISGTINIKVTGPAQVTGASSSNPNVTLTASADARGQAMEPR